MSIPIAVESSAILNEAENKETASITRSGANKLLKVEKVELSYVDTFDTGEEFDDFGNIEVNTHMRGVVTPTDGSPSYEVLSTSVAFADGTYDNILGINVSEDDPNTYSEFKIAFSKTDTYGLNADTTIYVRATVRLGAAGKMGLPSWGNQRVKIGRLEIKGDDWTFTWDNAAPISPK